MSEEARKPTCAADMSRNLKRRPACQATAKKGESLGRRSRGVSEGLDEVRVRTMLISGPGQTLKPPNGHKGCRQERRIAVRKGSRLAKVSGPAPLVSNKRKHLTLLDRQRSWTPLPEVATRGQSRLPTPMTPTPRPQPRRNGICHEAEPSRRRQPEGASDGHAQSEPLPCTLEPLCLPSVPSFAPLLPKRGRVPTTDRTKTEAWCSPLQRYEPKTGVLSGRGGDDRASEEESEALRW